MTEGFEAPPARSGSVAPDETQSPTDPAPFPPESEPRSGRSRNHGADPSGKPLWVPDNVDGSGWAPVDWASTARGSRYHYRHGEPIDRARATAPAFYQVVTRLESASLAPHENSYYISREHLADFIVEITLAGGAEVIWHVEPSPIPPPESGVG